MKKITAPRISDESILDELADNPLLSGTSYPHLRIQLAAVKAGYVDYLANRGNAWQITSPVLTQPLSAALIKHYTTPPKSVNYLDRIRNSSPDVCPMCGGFHPTTLDHILPKEDYPAWSIYSFNLVPACGCNMKRGTALKGMAGTGARVLHPYFDDVLSVRNLTATFTHSSDFSWVEAKVDYVDRNHAQFSSIQYHVRNVVIKAGIEQWFRGRLNILKERPYSVIKTLPKRRIIQLADLGVFLDECLEDLDIEFGTPNNWNSVLMHGLVNSPQLHDWIVESHNATIA